MNEGDNLHSDVELHSQRGMCTENSMSERQISPEDQDAPGLYEIRIKGHLENRWVDWFAGLTITLETSGTTRLRGPVADQAALHGLLRRVRDLGLPLISVIRIEPESTDGPDATP